MPEISTDQMDIVSAAAKRLRVGKHHWSLFWKLPGDNDLWRKVSNATPRRGPTRPRRFIVAIGPAIMCKGTLTQCAKAIENVFRHGKRTPLAG